MDKHKYIQMMYKEEDGYDIFVCEDCGQFAETTDKVIHATTCRIGESEYWKEHYSKCPENIFDDDDELLITGREV